MVTTARENKLRQRSAMQVIATVLTVTNALPALVGLAGHSGHHVR